MPLWFSFCISHLNAIKVSDQLRCKHRRSLSVGIAAMHCPDDQSKGTAVIANGMGSITCACLVPFNHFANRRVS